MHSIRVGEGLHLKSAISSIAPQVVAVEDSAAARAMFEEMQVKARGQMRMVVTEGAGAANTVRVGDTVICAAMLRRGSGTLQAHYERHAKQVVAVDISEFHKVDGGLTCLSLLLLPP